MASAVQLDHIVILLSPEDFQTVPRWLSENFTTMDGGTHAKGTSHNKLVVLEDGSYLELFSWIDPQPEGVEPHSDFPSWAEKAEGQIIDWALTGGNPQVKHNEVTTILKQLTLEGQSLGLAY